MLRDETRGAVCCGAVALALAVRREANGALIAIPPQPASNAAATQSVGRSG